MSRDEYLHIVRSARARVRTVERELMHPRLESWDKCWPALEDAACLVAALECEVRLPAGLEVDFRSELRDEVAGLRRDLRRMTAVANTAVDHYHAISQLLCVALSGYSPDGNVVAMRTAAQFCAQG